LTDAWRAFKSQKNAKTFKFRIKLHSNSTKLNSSSTQVNQDTTTAGCDNRHHPGSVAAKHTRKRGLTSKKLKDQFEVFNNPSGIYLPEYCPQDLPWAFSGFLTCCLTLDDRASETTLLFHPRPLAALCSGGHISNVLINVPSQSDLRKPMQRLFSLDVHAPEMRQFAIGHWPLAVR
jgi:hypothetical protein